MNGKGDDPAPHPLDIHFKELDAVIDRIGNTATEKLLKTEESIGNILRTWTGRVESVKREVESLGGTGEVIVNYSAVMEDSAHKLAEQINVQVPKLATPPEPRSLPKAEPPRFNVPKFDDKSLDTTSLDMTLSPDTETILKKLR